MKKFAIALIAVAIFSIQWHHAQAQTNLSKTQNESKVTTQIKEPTPDPVVQAPKQWHELTYDEQIKLNPNKCDLATHDIWASDGSCHAKTTISASDTQNASHALSGGSCEAEIAKYDWPQGLARAVMLAESSGDPNNLNDDASTGDYSVGCFQVNIRGANARTRPSEAELKNAEINVRWSYNHYVALGRTFGTSGGWGAYTSGKYLKYMN